MSACARCRIPRCRWTSAIRGWRAELEQPEAREAMLALLVQYAVKSDRPPAISGAVGDLRERLRRDSVGVDFHDWGYGRPDGDQST